MLNWMRQKPFSLYNCTYIHVCMYARIGFLAVAAFKLGSTKVSITCSFFISRPVCFSCMFSKLWAAVIAAGFFPENCTEFQQQQNTQYFSTMPCDWEGERGRSHGWNAFARALLSPLWHKCQFNPFFTSWKSDLWLCCLPKFFCKMGNVSDFLT